MAGYHLNEIPKGEYGFISKVIEECHEYQDALEQDCKLMADLELADIYGALESIVLRRGLTMDDIIIMSDITKRAFRSGERK
jgi:hypothetical protein